MNLETRRFILGIIMFFFFLTLFSFAYKLALIKGFNINLIFSMAGSLLFCGCGFFIVLKNTEYF